MPSRGVSDRARCSAIRVPAGPAATAAAAAARWRKARAERRATARVRWLSRGCAARVGAGGAGNVRGAAMRFARRASALVLEGARRIGCVRALPARERSARVAVGSDARARVGGRDRVECRVGGQAMGGQAVSGAAASSGRGGLRGAVGGDCRQGGRGCGQVWQDAARTGARVLLPRNLSLGVSGRGARGTCRYRVQSVVRAAGR
mmetsp:Transcript_57912/g.135987  ORF Transcript_57912/g.135987 Transcript_57912/m.135987 type:complete len:205 (+) Transcript_57912:90-704(+)